MKFCENLSKISRFKIICPCLNSTTSTRTRRDINYNPIYFNKINSNKHYSNNLEFADNNNNRNSPKFKQCNLNKIIYFSNEKENQIKNVNMDNNNYHYSNNSKSLYFNNKNLRGNYSCYCLKDKSSNNYNKREIIMNNNSHSNIIKDRRCISKIKLSSNKTNDQNFYCKNNSFKNNNSSIIKYSQNIVSKSKNIYIDKNKYKYMSSNNISLPKKINKCQNINYVSFYNDNIPFNKDYSNKNNIFSDRIHYRSYKTILNDENNKENFYMNKNNTFLDQQILDYLNNNYEEKNNLIKKMNNQKIENYKKNLEEQNLLNKNYTNHNFNKDNKTKIITLNNLNNYSYINNNYNYFYNNNYNSINNNFLSNSKKSLCPNHSKNRIKKSNKKCNMRISNYTNENINTNNIRGNKILLNEKYEDINHPLNNTSKNIIKNKIFNSFIHDNYINSPKKYKIVKFNDKKISPSKIYKEEINNNINNNSIKNNYKKINLKGKFETITGYHSVDKLNMNQNKNKMKMKKKLNKNVIQKSLNLFFYNSTKHNKNEKNENIFPINKTLNINISVPKSEKIEVMKDSKVSLKNSKRKMFYKIIHKKCNSISGNINNKKIRKIKIYNNIPKELNRNKNENEIMKNDAEKEKGKEKGKENESVLSLQSMNDSKILELANKFIVEEEKFNKDEIIEILNKKKENNKG